MSNSTPTKIDVVDPTDIPITEDVSVSFSYNDDGSINVEVEVTGKTVTSSPKSIKVLPSQATSSIIAEDLTRAYNSQYDFKARLLD